MRRGAVGDAYQRLRDSVCASQVVHTDDTGWRVGGEGAFLMAFETEDATVYQVAVVTVTRKSGRLCRATMEE